MIRKIAVVVPIVVPVVLLSASLLTAQTMPKPESPASPPMGQMASGHVASGHVMVSPDQITWGPAPPGLPPGAQVAVLDGDPSKVGAAYTMRAKLPDGYKVPPHWHPSDENLLVLSGTLLIGPGEMLDAAKAQPLTMGTYAKMPKEMRHFAIAKGETIFQVYGIGPFGITYVNPADDPRGAMTKK